MLEFLKNSQYKKFSKWIGLSVCVGLLSGLAASLFLYLLESATTLRLFHTGLIWLLPLAGFLVGWVYHIYGKDVAGGNNLVLQEIHNPNKVLPLKMAPLILGGTLLTHLFGGSAGREGTAVQMSASLADQLARPFGLSGQDRRALLVAGAGAGFGAAVGAPWAGVIFGMEVIHVGKLKLFAFVECLIASFVAFAVTKILGAPHSIFPSVSLPDFSFKLFGSVLFAGILFGLIARLFSHTTHFLEKIQKKFINYSPLKPLLGGLILLFLFWLEGSYRYAGLGIDVIQESLQGGGKPWDAFLKAGFTSVTLASGFKGGEFVPLVFVGSAFGSLLGSILDLSPAFLAALGFAAVFAGASNTPLACSLMAAEIFGWSFLPAALVACYLSFYVSGHSGIYVSQKYEGRKYAKITQTLSLIGELPRRFMNRNGDANDRKNGS